MRFAITLYGFQHRRDTVNEMGMGRGLVYYASDAAREMEFADTEEFLKAVEDAIQICLTANLPVEDHFRAVFRNSYKGTGVDWKLSKEAYHLVCMSGSPLNPHVARIRFSIARLGFPDADNQVIEP